MPSGIYIRTDEHKRKIANASKGRVYGSEARKNMSIAQKLSYKKGQRKTPKKGWKLSEETKKKLSALKLGKKLSKEHCKNIGLANLGKKRSEEAKQGMMRGEQHHNWKGGRERLLRYKALKRDKNSCQCWFNCPWHLGKICGFSFKEALEVDHVKPKKLFPQERYNLENLMTLCSNCHRNKTTKDYAINK